MTSAVNEKSIRKRNDQNREDIRIARIIVESLMSNKMGRRWVHLQLEFAQLHTETGNLDPQVMAFAAGRRNTGLKLLKEVQGYTPALYVKMLEENSGVNLTEPVEEETND